MSHVLYRKYRSQTFDELIGQSHITTLLKNAVAQGQIAHAYLFYGPRGLGKTSTARILAKAVNCLQLKPDGNPCGTCRHCTAIRDGSFLDLIEIDAASNRGIDQMRELKERIEFSPTEAKMKVYIIDEVHMLTTEAFNALLKTLEEPPPHAMFILATTEIHKVPATILSRCQRFDFRLGTDDEIKKLLSSVAKEEGVAIDDGAMKLMIENARGSYRDALSLLDVVASGQKADGDEKHITQEEVSGALGLADSTMVYFFLEKIVNGEASEALNLVQELSQKGVNLGQFLKFVLSVLREILVAIMRGDVGALEYSFAKKLDRTKTLKLINLCVESERSLRDALVPSLPLELLVADSLEMFGGEDGGGGTIQPNSSGADDGSDDRKKAMGKGVTKDEKRTVVPDENKHPDQSIEVKNSAESSADAKKEPVAAHRSKPCLSLSEEDLKRKWVEVLKGLRPYNSHLYAFVGRARVRDLTDGVLTLAVAFDFHKDRIESPKSKDAIAKVFKEVFGCPVKLNCVLDDSIRPPRTNPDMDVVALAEAPTSPRPSAANIYNSVADVFGSDLVGL
jgi:DNA polymerase III subunit gamma/tau